MEENSTYRVSDRRRGCVSDRYRTGSRSLEGSHTRVAGTSSRSPQRDAA